MSVLRSMLIVLLCAPALAGAADGPWQGRPVVEYIESLQARGLGIIYSSDLLDASMLVAAEPTAADPRSALEAVLKVHGLTLSAGSRGRLLVVRAGCPPFGIRVRVVDALTNLPVADATLTIEPDRTATTDAEGRGAIRCLANEPVQLRIAAADYLQTTVRLDPDRDAAGERRIQLLLAPEPLPEIVVSSSMYTLTYEAAGSHRFLDRELTTRLPDLGDEAIRSVDRLPGTANGGVSSRTHVRGGNDGEQLILLDGLRLYEPFHLKDFLTFSTIVDQRAIAGIDFYSAGYPARYGDRMSGVIDMSLREAPQDPVTELGISLFNTSALSTGRFGADRQFDWLVSARRGNLDLVARALRPDYGTPMFEDALGHIGWRAGERTYVSANLLFSYDKLTLNDGDDIESARARYTNLIGWIKAESDWNDRLSSTTLVSLTDLSNERRGTIDNPGIVSGAAEDDREFQVATLRQDWRYSHSDSVFLRAGFDVKKMQADYVYRSQRAITPPFDGWFGNSASRDLDLAVAPDGNQYSAYGELRWRPFASLVIDFGLRWDKQTYTLADSDSQVSPRFNTLLDLGERSRLRLSAGRFHQAQEINELQIIDGIATFFPASRATHFVAGIEHDFRNGLRLGLEAWHKDYHRLLPRYENRLDPLILLPDLQVDRARIDARQAEATGVELMLSSDPEETGPQWWASYTWSVVEDRTSGGSVRRSWDQPHTLKGGINWDWRRWNFSAAAAWHTGWPRTPVVVASIPAGNGTTTFDAQPGSVNSARHSDFHSLDVRASRNFNVRIGELSAFVEISNLYNAKNQCCTEFRRVTDADGNDVLLTDRRHWLPLIPSIGVLWSF